MNATEVSDIPISFLGKTTEILKGRTDPEVQDCLLWLGANGFTERRFVEFRYCPVPGHQFEVLRPLESCGNGDGLPVLDRGVWECVRCDFNNSSSYWAEFSSRDGRSVRLRVGYIPIGGHSVMAWKGNIR